MTEPSHNAHSSNPADQSGKAQDPLLKTILVINDARDILALMVAQLNRHGFPNVLETEDGKKALEILTDSSVDLVISDINMPNIDGFQLCRILRSGEFCHNENVPIILVSATYRDIDAEQLAGFVGANAYLQAPYDEHRLIELVLAFLDPSDSDRKSRHNISTIGNVLVLDDDKEILDQFKNILEGEPYNLVVTDDPDFAQAEMNRLDFQVLFLDVHIPKLSGMEMLKWAKKQFPGVVVIMMTAHGKGELVVDLICAGADDYVKKPLLVDELSFICQKALRRHNLSRIHEQFREKINSLKEIKDYLDNLIDNSQDAIFSIDRNSRIIVWNIGAEKIYGWRASEVIGKPVDQFVDPPNHNRTAQEVLHTVEQHGAFTEKEVYRRKKDGTIFPVNATYSSIINFDGEVIGMSVVEKDVSNTKRLEKELIKTERLRVITQLAVTANDQINTPLGVILGYSQFLKHKLKDLPPEDEQYLDIIISQVSKIKDIMKQLRQISKPIVKDYAIEGVTMIDLGRSKQQGDKEEQYTDEAASLNDIMEIDDSKH